MSCAELLLLWWLLLWGLFTCLAAAAIAIPRNTPLTTNVRGTGVSILLILIPLIRANPTRMTYGWF